jgi:hypothetical protein
MRPKVAVQSAQAREALAHNGHAFHRGFGTAWTPDEAEQPLVKRRSPVTFRSSGFD